MILKIGYDSDTVASVQRMLNFLGYLDKPEDGGESPEFAPLEEDGVFGPLTEKVVLDFQESEGILRDGMVGPVTMSALEESYMGRVMELNSPGASSVDSMPDRMVFSAVPSDKYLGSYKQVYLRSDAASAYKKVYEAVKAAGGIMTASAGVRSLKTEGSPSRSATSFHYLGLAFDLYLYGAMWDLEKDPYVVARESERLYRVYVRCEPGLAEKQGIVETTVENVISHRERMNGRPVKGHFLDLTALFEENGFGYIPARAGFEEGGSMLKAEWWHFQYERGLTPMVSTFGRELLRVYSEETLQGTTPWKYRNHIFKRNWF